MDLPLVLGWIFTIIGVIAAILLVIHIETGKDFSIPFSVGCVIVLSLFLGLGFQFLLVSQGL